MSHPSPTPADSDLAPKYAPLDVEREVAARWTAANAFHAEPDAPGKPYAIVIPPPNVTAALHMGHALNNTLQDILTRYHRMLGDNTMWMPGTDHAGIATQTIVDKRLREEGQPGLADYKKMELEGGNGREQFLGKVTAWKDEYEAFITNQLKMMGCSCDWDRQRFTMDEICAKSVREAFFQLFKDGLIYRGKRLVNWDPVSLTALADDEVEMEEVDGFFYYLKYPVVEVQSPESGVRSQNTSDPQPQDSGPGTRDSGLFLTVATTRPETMLGDTAVAINPKDPRAAALRGKFVRLPIVNRIIPIIEDDYVVLPIAHGGDPADTKAQFATGFLKVTPAHDPNDYEIGRRHNLPVINVMAPDASISKDHGWPAEEWPDTPQAVDASASPSISPVSPFTRELLGKSREEARKLIVDWFKQHDLLEEMKPYKHSVGHSYRSHVPVEPYLSDQWYVKVTDDRLAGAALKAMAVEQQSPSDGPAWKQDVADDASPDGMPTIRAWSADIGHRYDDFRGNLGALAGAMQKAIEAALEKMGVQGGLTFTTTGSEFETMFHVHATTPQAARALGVLQSAITGGPAAADVKADAVLRSHPLVADSKQSQKLGAEDAKHIGSAKSEGDNQSGPGHFPAGPWKEKLRFYPERYAKTFQQWHENIRDWCISRQLWWGHRIPVWSGSRSSASELFQNIREVPGAHGVFYTTINGPEFPFVESTSEAGVVHLCVPAESEWVEHLLRKNGFTQDPDVLDTWFSSGLWPISTLGWPDENPALQKWNPSNTLCTAREIITLWVSRMVMFNIYFRGCLPFKDVFIHAMIQDGHGQKMSKTLGNGIDPLDIIHSHGSDAMRFTLASMTTSTQDVRMTVEMVCPHTQQAFTPKFIKDKAGYMVAAPIQECPTDSTKKIVSSYGYSSGKAKPTAEIPVARNTSEKFDYGRNFANKLWNAVRFALGYVKPTDADHWAIRSVADQWILARLARTVLATTKALENYEFKVYADTLYDFIWRDFCDWYIEAIKPTVATDASQQRVLVTVIDVILRMLHPAMPFITEKLWDRLNIVAPKRTDLTMDGLFELKLGDSELLVKAPWPKAKVHADGAAAVEARFEAIRQIVSALREVRTSYKVAPKLKVDCAIRTPGPVSETLRDDANLIATLANVRITAMGSQVEKAADAASTTVAELELYLAGLIDKDAEKTRLSKRIAELEKSIAGLTGRLSNTAYTDKAPAKLVQETRDQLANTEKELETVKGQLAAL